MMHNERIGALFRFEMKALGQAHADVLFRLKQRKNLRLILKIRARRISKRVTRAAVLLVEEIADLLRILASNTEFFTNLPVPQLGQRFGCLYTEPMQIQIAREVARIEE